MYLVNEHSIMQKPERAIEFLLLKSKNASNKGISTALPPMPAIEHRARKHGKIIEPANSLAYNGKTLLCTHRPD